MITVYLARHATPDWQRKDIPYYLPPGPPLVEQGEREAVQLGKFLRQKGVCRIYTSPLERCLATARLATNGAGWLVEMVPGLIEIQPDETEPQIIQRLAPVFDQASRAAVDGPVCLLTHGGPVAILLGWLGMAADTVRALRVYEFANLLPPAGAWEARQEQSGEPWQLGLVFTPDAQVDSLRHK